MSKASFCRSLDWPDPLNITWLDLTGIVQIDDDRRATITLATYGYSGHYPGFRVEIVSKTTGQIDSKFFTFDDYLPRDLAHRTDGRTDYPLGTNPCFEVIDHCGWEWYIGSPVTTRPYTEAIATYVEMFR